MQKEQRKSTGFTLIELSIVLVVIGLLAGGVLVGRDLIYAAKIRNLGSELNQIKMAITAFRSKYDCLPGDCANATNFFGANSGGCPAGGGNTGTCDGNGDAFLNAWAGAGNKEHFFAWQQMAIAGYFPWKFSPTSVVGGAGYVALVTGKNIPSSSFKSGLGYNFYSIRSNATGAFKKTIEIGAPGSPNDDVLSGAGLNAPEAMVFDSKFDDGKPESGKIVAVGTASGSIIPSYNTIDVQASNINPNTNCVSSGNYYSSATSGCTIEFIPDVP